MKEVPWTTRRAPGQPCPYLEGKVFTQEYFLARGMDGQLWSALLAQGWRHFGTFFFRPRCEGCQACTPLRLPVERLELSPSLKKVWNKNQDLVFQVEDLAPTPELYQVYAGHAVDRFGETPDPVHFQDTFFGSGVPGALTTYRMEGKLAAAGFTDWADDALSSVYFVYRPQDSHRSLGTYSVLRECRWAQEKGLRYYYLGYWVPGNARMTYKHRFRVREVMDWTTGEWKEDPS